MAAKKISQEVLKLLEGMNMEALGPKLDALGVRGVQDLALVDDADLVRWGLSTIERRRFFKKIRIAMGDAGGSADLGFLPPSALTQSKAASKKQSAPGRPKTRSDAAKTSMGPARMEELLGRGSAEYQVPRLAERMLAASGPVEIAELAVRISRAAPALAAGHNGNEWTQFVETTIRGYSRLSVEDGVLAGDKPIASIRSTMLFSASEEVISDTAVWLRVATGLAAPSQVVTLATLCRASREVADGPDVWSKLLARWYPKASLVNPDWLARKELEKRLEAALDNDYTLAALTRRLENDTPLDIGDLLRALPQQTTPKVLVKFMSSRPEHFKQAPDGKKFAVSLKPDEWRNCKDWRAVNPFTNPPMPKGEISGQNEGAPQGRTPVAAPMGRPTALKQHEKDVANSAPPAQSAVSEAAAPAVNICQQLDPKQAFRLYHTGLLTQGGEQSKLGRLAAGDLLNLAEERCNAIRRNDPAVIHDLVGQTLEGVVYKVPFGYWNRRVRIVTSALNASQLSVGREEKKQYERKLLEFMEWVKTERGFGFYKCANCGSRWKSGFAYEEMMQQCLTCGTFSKPYRIQDLESKEEREKRQTVLDGKATGLPPPEGAKKDVPVTQSDASSTPMTIDPPETAPSQMSSGIGRRRAWQGFSVGSDPVEDRATRPRTETSAPEAATQATGGSEPTSSGPAATQATDASGMHYNLGGGGFFARRRAAQDPGASGGAA